MCADRSIIFLPVSHKKTPLIRKMYQYAEPLSEKKTHIESEVW